MKTFIILALFAGLALSTSKMERKEKNAGLRAMYRRSGCADKLNNCDAYGKSVCTNTAYAAWAADNCCAYCSTGGTSSGGGGEVFQLHFGTAAPAPSSICVDVIDNCAAYGSSICSDNTYAQWVESNCKKFCNKCYGGGVQAVSRRAGCTNKLSNCANYGKDVCTNPTYTKWATDNCCEYCGLGGTSSGGGGGDVFQLHFGTSAPASTCVDAIDNCAAYTSSICSDSTYTQWVADNCKKFCNKCSGGGGGGSVPSIPNTGSQPTGGMTGQSSGCVYKGQVYQQGQSFKDGCLYQCTCEDGATGKYTCNSLCLTWNLPAACHLNPPAPGKCCKTPNCPPGYTLQYPPDYVEN